MRQILEIHVKTMQFGDFFNDMVVNVALAATSATAGTVPKKVGIKVSI